MLKTILTALRSPELRKKLLFTAFILACFRLGSYVPVPGVDTDALQAAIDQRGIVVIGTVRKDLAHPGAAQRLGGARADAGVVVVQKANQQRGSRSAECGQRRGGGAQQCLRLRRRCRDDQGIEIAERLPGLVVQLPASRDAAWRCDADLSSDVETGAEVASECAHAGYRDQAFAPVR